jgi:hypothetical protein
MKLIPLGSNQNLVRLNSGVEVLFSYRTPVAAFVPGTGYVRTNHNWSRTTSKHINRWLGKYPCGAVDQSFLDNLVGV